MKKALLICLILIQFMILISCASTNEMRVGDEALDQSKGASKSLPLSFRDISPEATLFSPSQSLKDLKGLGSAMLIKFGRLSWPLKKFRFVRGFKPEGVGDERHLGVDLAAPLGTKVYASRSGYVIYAGDDFSGYGKIVILGHNDGELSTFYSHLSDFDVTEGEEIKRGSVIGRVGSTGRSTGNHLHFEVRSKRYGVLDPMLLLKN